MKKRYWALSLVAAFGAVAAYTVNEYNDAVAEQAAIHVEPRTEREICVRDAALSAFPNAIGGVILEEDRAYGGEGSFIHYRDRGLNEVHSVAAYDEGYWVVTRTDPVAVMPDRLTLNGFSSPFEQRFTSYGGYQHDDGAISTGDSAISEKHEQVIEALKLCY